MRNLIKRNIRKILGKIFAALQHSYYLSIYDEYRKKHNIHPSFRFNGQGILFYGEGKITCEEGSKIGRYSSIEAAEDCEVTIGKNVQISHDVMIYTESRDADQNFSIS